MDTQFSETEAAASTGFRSSVAEASALDPLFFAILISEIDAGVLTATNLTYADDTKIFKAIESFGDSKLLQNDLANLFDWSYSNNQNFNAKKFESLSYSKEALRNLYLNPSDDPILSKDHIR